MVNYSPLTTRSSSSSSEWSNNKRLGSSQSQSHIFDLRAEITNNNNGPIRSSHFLEGKKWPPREMLGLVGSRGGYTTTHIHTPTTISCSWDHNNDNDDNIIVKGGAEANSPWTRTKATSMIPHQLLQPQRLTSSSEIFSSSHGHFDAKVINDSIITNIDALMFIVGMHEGLSFN